MRHPFSPFCSSVASFFLALTLAGCGEIELPQPDEGPDAPTEQPDGNKGSSSSDDDRPSDGDDSNPEGSGSANGDDDSGSDNQDSIDNQDGAADKPAADLHIGNACLTADGHLLIADRLYLSLEEFKNVSSAGGANPTEAAEIAAAYVEGNLTGWRVPTERDVSVLQDALACASPSYVDEGTETLPPLNRELDARGYYGLYREWYIYGDASHVFGFTFETTTKKASGKSLYQLRLVHDK